MRTNKFALSVSVVAGNSCYNEWQKPDEDEMSCCTHEVAANLVN